LRIYTGVSGVPDKGKRRLEVLLFADKEKAASNQGLGGSDKLSDERNYKILTVLDEYTRKVLYIAVRPKMRIRMMFWTHCTRCLGNTASQSLFDLITA
jgi:hypothetical protein